MTTSAASQAGTTGAVTWSRRRICACLLGYGAILAILAIGALDSGLPTSKVVLQQSRQSQLANALSVLEQGGPPLLTSTVPYRQGLKNHGAGFYPADQTDDPGIYLYLPVAGHLLGDSNPLSLEKWFAILGMALIPLLYPLLFFLLFDSIAAAVVVPLVALGAVRDLVNTDIYWITAWCVLLGMPIVYLALRYRRRTGLALGLLAVAALVASFATSVRSGAGIGVALAAFGVGVIGMHGWRRRVAAGAIVVVAYLSIATGVIAGVRAYRDHVSHMPPSPIQSSHSLWHPAYLGLGYLPNKWGIRWEDLYGLEAAQRVDPKVLYQSAEYNHILRHLYFSAVRDDPGWAFHLYVVKLAALLHAAFRHYWLGLIVLPFVAVFGMGARRLRLRLLILVPALAIAAVPSLIAIPTGYDAGFLGAVALISFLVLGTLLEDAAPAIRKLPSLQLGTLLDGQPASKTIDEARTTARAAATRARRGASRPLVAVVAIALVLGTAAAVAASAFTSSNADKVFFAAKASPIVPAPTGATTVTSWNGTDALGTWTTQNGALTSPRGDGSGVDVTTAISLVDPQLVSPGTSLPAGTYGVRVSGDISSGGMLVEAVPQGGQLQEIGSFWPGQSGLRQPGMYGTFTLTAPANVSIALLNWARTPRQSKWTIGDVTLLRLPKSASG